MVHLDKANGDVKVFPQTPPALQWPRKLRLRDCLLERQWDYSRRVDFGIPTDSFMRQIPDFPSFLALTPYLGSGMGARVAGWWLSFSPMTLGKARSFPETLFSSVNMGKDSRPGTRLGESLGIHSQGAQEWRSSSYTREHWGLILRAPSFPYEHFPSTYYVQVMRPGAGDQC